MVEMAQCSLVLTSPPIRGQYLGSLISIRELLNYYHRYLMLFLQFHHSFLDSDPLFPILGSLLGSPHWQWTGFLLCLPRLVQLLPWTKNLEEVFKLAKQKIIEAVTNGDKHFEVSRETCLATD